MKKYVKALRQQQTDAERLLWQILRNRKFYGFKFRRQYQIEYFIVDFICLERKLIIELDGEQHLDCKTYDNCRTKFLMKLGYKVLRFWNDQISRKSSLF